MTVHLYPYSTDLMAAAAAHLMRETIDLDFSRWVILVPDRLGATALRNQCLQQAAANQRPAVLGLQICSLHDWIDATVVDTQIPLNEAARRLLLVEALRQHPDLFADDDPWRIADSLLTLFDELTRYHSPLTDNRDAFVTQLARGYAIRGTIPIPLTREADILYRLWQAWQEQTLALARPDPWDHYLAKLQHAASPQATEPFYLMLGFQALIPAERQWLATRLAAGCAQWWIHGNPSPRRGAADAVLNDLDRLSCVAHHPSKPDPVSDCLEQLFPNPQLGLRARAMALAKRYRNSPLQGVIHSLAAQSAEQEARAIELQVRRWLLAGKRRIGIVTDDRRLARRVRALLERATIVLQDSAGWALSTTSAASCLERWLQCIEEDFAHQPLLDVLKSPFLCTAEQRDQHLSTVYRLERDIIQHENIGRGLQRYRRHVEYRRQRLAWPAAVSEPLQALLEHLAQAAQPLLSLQTESASATQFLVKLRASLEQLGVWQGFESDAAGQAIIRLWETLLAAAQQTPLQLNWTEFRIWLGRSLEETRFTPETGSGPVQLLTLAQAQAFSFDALAIGACDREHLPGREPANPFFNSGVRRELGLPTWEQQLALQLYQFRRLLQAAPAVMLSWHREQQGEPLLPSPWLEALETLHAHAFGTTLADVELMELLHDERSAVATAQPAPLPAPPQQPQPAAPVDLLPTRISPSSHQHLIDCPYLYFAADCLQLAPPEAVRELLQKSDYGERVHLCLQALHGPVEQLPGPFTQAFTAATREHAIALLERIAHAVFARDLEDNFQHRGWLKRWLALIPSYIDWQIERAASWQVEAVEARLQTNLPGVGQLKGRLDRIDRAAEQRAIIDYKTGAIPSQAAIDSGEAVQLPLYALLAGDRVQQVEYLRLDGLRVRSQGLLQNAELDELCTAVANRLLNVQTALAAGARLPAWGDPESCRHCSMAGICRRPAWTSEPPST